ncbi:hypothetical protein HNP72_000243 [Sphingobacterium soli]|nr:hypothetical protein [Sphingobacterium soli]
MESRRCYACLTQFLTWLKNLQISNNPIPDSLKNKIKVGLPKTKVLI